jgi:hypothetical protein
MAVTASTAKGSNARKANRAGHLGGHKACRSTSPATSTTAGMTVDKAGNQAGQSISTSPVSVRERYGMRFSLRIA